MLLSGYRVLDLANETGMLAGRILADFGADVIAVEPPGGSPVRNRGPFYHDIPDPEKSLTWFAYNLNKRSLTLDIGTGDGQQIFRRLVAGAHFIIETFPPGYLDSIGLGYHSLMEINPGIILCSVTPFGQTGPYRDYQTSELVALASGGLLYICGDPDRPPVRANADIAYCEVGVQAATAMMIAHHYRRLTGEGQQVDVSVQECVTGILWHNQQFWDLNREIVTRLGIYIKGIPINSRTIYRCQDGSISWQLLVAYQGAWTRHVVEWMEEEGAASDELKSVSWEELDYAQLSPQQILDWEDEFARFFLTKPKAELQREAINRGIMLFPCTNIEDCYHDQQLAARNFWIPVAHPELGDSLTYPGAPLKLNEAPWRVSRRPPLIGEHNGEIYGSELGFSEGELDRFQEQEVI